MREGALALYLLLLLTFASHGVWCAAHHHLRLHQHETEGESTQTATQGERTQTARKVGRMAGGTGAGSGRNTGGGATDTGPHNTKNGSTVALPAAATSALALVLAGTALLWALGL